MGLRYRSYTKSGFSNPKLTNQTKAGKHLNFCFLSLEYNPTSMQDNPSVTIRKANLLKEYYEARRDKCSYKVHLGPELCEKLYSYLDKDKEYSGTLVASNSSTINNNSRILNLVFPIQTEIRANSGKFAVTAPPSMFNFHTHPSICYNTLECYIAWPSGPDMSYVVNQYDIGLLQHFVITLEGIYQLQMTINFMKFGKN